jgi:aminomethyltransferase
VTYSDHGYSVGAVLASAHIETAFAVDGAEVVVDGVKAVVSRRAFVDPEGARLRA